MRLYVVPWRTVRCVGRDENPVTVRGEDPVGIQDHHRLLASARHRPFERRPLRSQLGPVLLRLEPSEQCAVLGLPPLKHGLEGGAREPVW